ncbi:hypothetical protein GCK72_020985 [Caenorhabditis remanei]|uniref:Uncharacterized protein n=1 Tax=Caenorhabditis remanei TaxID=31234 RepID=A0A6A5GI17_CAERE|nr:hypothetical protein GCK72_020985 [Caenorhabditis remanei]KAF1754424.1 hypothetical protein GCK72_020985 [Caenorhabditis remanei]
MLIITLLHIIHYSGSIAAQITNAILLYLIIKKAGTLFESYRYVMGTFSVYSLIYAWIDAATCPVMLIYGPAFVVYMDGLFKLSSPYPKIFQTRNDEQSERMEIEKVMFFGPMYWGIGENGEKKWNIEDLLSAVGCFSIITLLPIVMMYSPVGLIITFPFFEVPVGRAANFVGASLSIYPCLEPLIAMICIKDFRMVIFG